ncbi:MAG: type I-C CRISPR-associated endonuclease Cas1c [Caldisericia bacterium]|nr:type I-C CRISPR-associated endonuclease Cas1c [Caldisericia bacterium]
MKKLLNTLYVMNPDSYLTRDGLNVVLRVDNQVKFQIPVHNLESIICFNHSGASPSLMSLCTQNNVGITFLTPSGFFLARVTGKVNGNVLLRRKQFRLADDQEISTIIAKSFITGKIANARSVLLRFIRDHSEKVNTEDLLIAIKTLTSSLQKIQKAETTDTVRGIEGDAAKVYFGVFDKLILVNKKDFFFIERNRRPPLDNVNTLLSFVYTLLVHDMQSALESVGLDPSVGFLHVDRPGRASLALDMIEELRPYLADRIVLSLVNRKQVDASDFIASEAGGIMMKDEAKKKIITTWQKRKQELILHPYFNEKIEIGLIPYSQALLLSRYIRGDLDGYPPFFSR